MGADALATEGARASAIMILAMLKRNNLVPAHYGFEAEWRIYASVQHTTIASDNGLSPVRRQAIISSNAGILLIGPLGTNFSEILIKINTFSFKKCIWKCRQENGGHFVSASMC